MDSRGLLGETGGGDRPLSNNNYYYFPRTHSTHSIQSASTSRVQYCTVDIPEPQFQLSSDIQGFVIIIGWVLHLYCEYCSLCSASLPIIIFAHRSSPAQGEEILSTAQKGSQMTGPRPSNGLMCTTARKSARPRKTTRSCLGVTLRLELTFFGSPCQTSGLMLVNNLNFFFLPYELRLTTGILLRTKQTRVFRR